MNSQIIITQRLVVDGKPMIVSLIQNPTIDDILVTEAQIQATTIEEQSEVNPDRRVERDIRDFLIRLGVER